MRREMFLNECGWKNMSQSQATLSLAIPLYNEESNINKVIIPVLSELEKGKVNYELILVDNGSHDKTGQLIRELAERNNKLKIVRIEVNQGYGYGILKALEEASGKYVGFICGDGQVEPSDIVRVYHKLISDDLDLCKASRVIRQDGLQRKIISFFYNLFFSLLFVSIKSKDINATPKIMKREVYEKLNLKSRDWFIDAEVMIKCEKMGCKIQEVPITFYQRKEGVSNVRFSTILEFIKNILRYKLKNFD